MLKKKTSIVIKEDLSQQVHDTFKQTAKYITFIVLKANKDSTADFFDTS